MEEIQIYAFVPLLTESMKPISCLSSLQLPVAETYCSLTKKAAGSATVGKKKNNKMRLGISFLQVNDFPGVC